ncbi:MAG: diadenylate cyclase CdaA [Eubacteriales bacterium]|nr:diadenylate cyclase CdaA [Eubacteriales bacterium]
MHVNDVVDIAIVTFLIYQFIRLIRETSTSQIIRGVLVLLIAMVVSDLLDLVMLSTLFHTIITWGIIVLAIVFQPELRKVLRRVGETGVASFLFSRQNEITLEEAVVKEMVTACKEMSWSRTGALVIFERRDSLDEILKTGTRVDAKVVDELIRNIFYEGAPLHDGAMIVRDGRICAAGCVLPLSDNRNLAKELGTRHRAAVGMSERADSISLVVSEETGAISVAVRGKLQRNLVPEQLEELLTDALVPKEEENQKTSKLGIVVEKILGIRGGKA